MPEAEAARAARREEWLHADPDAARRREILMAGLEHVDRQLALVQRRRGELDALADELGAARGGCARGFASSRAIPPSSAG